MAAILTFFLSATWILGGGLGVLGAPSVLWSLPSPVVNWTMDYDRNLAEFALDFAAAAYSPDPRDCLKKHNATLIKRVQISCDYVHDECWAYMAKSDEWIVMSIRGTKTKLQLITELVETMSAPKKTFPAGGSVQRYFYSALMEIWKSDFGYQLRQLKKGCPTCKMLFTGHSLGGALVSLASSLFAFKNQDIVGPNEIFLITFGQPRVGNMDYSQAHDLLVPNSWRLIHRYDIVAHLPYCYETIFSHQCSIFYNHGPFHHGTEIWYPEDMDNATSIYRLCTGSPVNEDQQCSNGYYIHYRISDHLVYLGKDVSGYGNNGCVDAEETAKNKFKQLITNKTKQRTNK